MPRINRAAGQGPERSSGEPKSRTGRQMEVIVNTSYQGVLRAPYQQPSSFALVLAGVVAAVRKVGQVLKNRHDAAILAQFDDRMLSDIGISRSDLRDAYAEPLWRDPTYILASRARERRINRQVVTLTAPSLVPSETELGLPKANWRKRYAL
jgi:uncharacterized protein YjiS (DUF1127 family)